MPNVKASHSAGQCIGLKGRDGADFDKARAPMNQSVESNGVESGGVEEADVLIGLGLRELSI